MAARWPLCCRLLLRTGLDAAQLSRAEVPVTGESLGVEESDHMLPYRMGGRHQSPGSPHQNQAPDQEAHKGMSDHGDVPGSSHRPIPFAVRIHPGQKSIDSVSGIEGTPESVHVLGSCLEQEQT